MASARNDLLTGLFLFAFSALFFFFSFSFTQPAIEAEAQHVGPTFMPRLLLVILALLSLMLIFSGVSRIKRDESVHPGETKAFDPKPMIMFLVFAFYTYLATLMGFVSTTVLFLIVSFFILGVRKFWQILILAPAITAAVYYLFSNLLNVWLPEGIWI